MYRVLVGVCCALTLLGAGTGLAQGATEEQMRVQVANNVTSINNLLFGLIAVGIINALLLALVWFQLGAIRAAAEKKP